ncbi:amino acid adenylation domain-containing protein [Burkholderia cenocepacia]
MTSFPTALHHRIREQARRAPDAPALAAPFQNDLRLSRGALDARASRLARQLRAAGVGAEVRVGVCVERSCELFVALLAVLKAGGVFVPLDPRHPAARLDWIVADAQLRHGIVDAAGRAALGAPFEHAFDVTEQTSAAPDFVDDEEDAPVHPRAAAYMIYTSGSTGTPKAVVVEHGPLAAHCDALAAALPIEADDRLLHFASVNFDAAHECWLAPLAVGASVTIAPPQPFAPEAAHALMVREAVSVAAFPPAYLREFAAVAARDGVPRALRVLAFGGEALPQQAFEFVRRTFPSVRLINGYGPTEAVISPMLWPVEPGETPVLAADDAYASLPIGRAIGPRVARIDGEGGAAGELLLGGVCLARGYHGRPALTAERFVPDPHGTPGARVYRTGDLARLRDDGAFDYLGRLDDQVQVRGVRVEPAEIAACLRAHPAVADAGVVAEIHSGPTRLVACVVLHDTADDAALKAHVAAQLPAAWQPHRFERCDALPYTLNGKLDRAALRELIASRRAAAANDAVQRAGDAARTPTEQQLAGVWQTLLGLDAAPSRDDRFVALGADSLAVMQLQAAIRATARVNLRLDTLFADPSLAELADTVDRAERETGEAPNVIAARGPAADASAAAAPHVDRTASLAQQRFWVLAQTRDAGAAYHIAAHWTIDGALDRAALQRALDHVIERHEAWRTTLVDHDDGIVMQRIHAHLPVTIADIDLRDRPPAARDAEATRVAERDAGAPFDLARGPLVRATLVALADDRHRLLLTAHHAITDGWSSRCAFDELSAAYGAFAEGRAPSLPGLPIQYADYADWQRDMLAGGEGERQLDYWRAALRDVPGPLALPVDRQPPATRTLHGARTSVRLPDAVAADVRRLARDAQASVFTVLLAALDAWLSRLTGETDLVVAVPVAHRQRPETRALLGLFLNTVALRVRVAPTLPFRALVDATRTAVLDAMTHQDVPFERVVDAVKPPVKRGDEWLRVKFAQQFDARHDSVLPGATAVATPGPDLAARFDFALDFTDDANGIELVAAHATDCIDAETARAWLDSYAALLASAAHDPQCATAALPCDAAPASRQPRGGRALRIEHADVVAAFARQAAAYPHRVALADASTSLSFAELDDASNRVAHALQLRGAKAEAPVIVCVERSARFVVGLLGALKAGALAVLLDPAQPAARLAAAASDCGARHALVADPAGWPAGADTQPLEIDALMQDPVLALAAGVRVAPHPEQGAYLIYTSGSTGTPKGVVVSHGALADYVQGMLDELAFAPDASFAMVSTVAADLGHTTLFGALCAGRTLHLLPASCAFDPDAFADEMRRREVGVLKIVPSHLQALLDARAPADVLPRHALVTGGETLTWALVARLAALAPACRVINHYGPTEATVGALACDTASIAADRRDPASGVPLGTPLPNARALVLDAFGACVPPGATGELYLGGPGVARGYLNRPGQTAERFVPDPFARGARLYRTGDRARLGADGRIAFLGRIDDQVKIRGYRVEPGEVSAAVRAAGPIAQAETLAIEHDGRLRLATFIVMRDGASFDEAGMRAALAATLPDYMMPAQFVALARLPVTANGKIDRAALRALAAAPVASAAGDAPQGPVETVLADVWQAVLKAPQVGRDDNFFELGGDSILVLQVIARARKRGVRFTPKQLFDGPTVAELARVAKMDEAAAPHPAAAQAAPAAVARILTPAQQRFFALDVPRPGHWNQSVAFDVRGPFDADAFARAFDALLAHHDAFRQRFTRDANGAWQASDAARPHDALPFVEVAASDEADALARFDALQRRLDLGRGPLACACAARLPDGATQLYLAIHHAIVDGVSWRILLDDLEAAYRAAVERMPIRLSPPGLRADAWAARLARAATEPASPFAAEVAYWAGMASGDELVPDHPDAAATNAEAAVVVQTIDAALTRAALTDAHAAYRTQTIELLSAALAQALAGASGAASCRLELEGHGREALFDDADASRTIGWLTSHYPVTLPVAANLRDTLCAIKDTLRAVPHKGLGFGVLAHYGDAATRAALAAVPRPRVTFNYLGQFDAPRDAALVPRFGGAGIERDPQGPLGNTLAIHAYLDTDRDGARTLKMHWVYGAPQFERATIDALAARFAGALRELVDACASRVAHRGGGATPGDFPLAQAAGLTQAAIERTPLDWRTIDDVYPLSPMQQGILFHALFAPGQASYVNQLVATATALDADRLAAAFAASVARHDILRTSVMPDEAAPLQCVHRHARMPVEQLDWRTRGATLDADFDAWLAADRARGFDWREPPLMRLTLIRVTDDAWRIVWTRHHVLLDGWSTARLLADVLRDYRDPDAVSPFASRPPLRYRDFIAWLGTRDRDADERFWTERLARLDAPTLIAERAADRADTAVVSWRATIDAAATARVAQAARALKLTVNTLVQGAWALALQRMTHQPAVAFGATVAGRPDALPDIDAVLGLFINTVPVITAPAPQQRAADWLQALQRDNAAAAEHVHTPLADIQRWARGAGGALFDTLVVFENYPVDDTAGDGDPRALALSDVRSIEATDFALTLVIESGAELTIDYGYDTARLDARQVETWHRAFACALDALARTPDAPLGRLSIADATALDALARVQDTACAWPEAHRQPLHLQFVDAARATPDAIALEYADAHGGVHRATYRELDLHTSCVAAALRRRGVRPDTPVALCVERSLDMVIALVGVLKAGAAYLPVDPDYPAERIAYLLRDARPAVAITQAHLREQVEAALGDGASTQLLTVADLLAEGGDLIAAGEACAAAPVDAAQLAYLIYTSGSTGKPKGAGNTHGALANRIAWMQHAYRLTRDDVVLHKTPFGFDVSVWEFVWPLAVGAKLAIAAPGDHRDPARLAAAIHAHGVTVLHFVPSMLAAFAAHLDAFNAAAQCDSVRLIVASGEALAPELVAKLARLLPNATLVNLYGPTEAAIDVSHWTCGPHDAHAAAVPIGHPIANLQLHVLDAAWQPVPAGATGELYLAGAGLARGYLGRPALTAERFVPDPFVPGARMYRTGDLARRRADSALDYLGRVDTQVKLRGQRIEPGEIEALLRAAPGVHDAVVIVRDEQLIGYVARGDAGPLDRAALLDALRAQLPAYMVPSQLIELDALPVTPNGKCDRHALPAPVRNTAAAAELATDTERALAAIWQRVLHVDAIGRDDDFFLLGGHSLLATHAHAQANLHWGLALPLRTLFDTRTLARCAAAIDAACAARGASDAASAIDALLGELETQ